MSEDEKRDLPKSPPTPARKVTIVGMPLIDLSTPAAGTKPKAPPASPPIAAPPPPARPPAPPPVRPPARPPAPPPARPALKAPVAAPAPPRPPYREIPQRQDTMIGVPAPPRPSPPKMDAPDAPLQKTSLTEITQPFDLEDPITPPSPDELSAPTLEPGSKETLLLRAIGEREPPVIEAAAELAYLDVDIEPPGIELDSVADARERDLGEDSAQEESVGATEYRSLDERAGEDRSLDERAGEDRSLENGKAPAAPSGRVQSPPAGMRAEASPPFLDTDALLDPDYADVGALIDDASADRLSSPTVSSAGRPFLVKIFLVGATLLGIIALALVILFRGAGDEARQDLLAEPEPPAVAITARQRADEGRERAERGAQAVALEAPIAAKDPRAQSGEATEARGEHSAKGEPEAQGRTPADTPQAAPLLTSAPSAPVILAPPIEIDERYEELGARRRRAQGRELVNAANFLRNRNQHDEAIERYVDALSYDPGLAAAISGGVQSWLEKDEPATALAWAERLVEVLPASAGSHTLKARALLALGRVDEAAEAVEAARALNPQSHSVAELDAEIAAR